MTLGETIQYYRKRAGLSQEALAELAGVSRQAVSKWELDEATPEVTKLKALAGAFHITVDQLLSGEKPPETIQGSGLPPQASPGQRTENTQEPPGLWGMLGRMVMRNGWIFGIYVALGGLGTALVGGIARFAFDRMCRVSLYDSPFGQISVLSDMGQVFVAIATVILVIGILTAVAGAVLALWLYKKGRENHS